MHKESVMLATFARSPRRGRTLHLGKVTLFLVPILGVALLMMLAGVPHLNLISVRPKGGLKLEKAPHWIHGQAFMVPTAGKETLGQTQDGINGQTAAMIGINGAMRTGSQMFVRNLPSQVSLLRESLRPKLSRSALHHHLLSLAILNTSYRPAQGLQPTCLHQWRPPHSLVDQSSQDRDLSNTMIPRLHLQWHQWTSELGKKNAPSS